MSTCPVCLISRWRTTGWFLRLTLTGTLRRTANRLHCTRYTRLSPPMLSFLSRLTHAICSVSQFFSPSSSTTIQRTDIPSIYLASPSSAVGSKVHFPDKSTKKIPSGQAPPLRIEGLGRGVSMRDVEKICERHGRVAL
jgi:hypothetical protein